MGAAGVLMALRLGAMASGAEQTPAPATATATAAATDQAKPTTAASADVAAASAPAPDPATAAATCQPASAPAGQAQTKGEAEVLQNLSQRREALDARERDLALREQLMGATEKQMTARLGELKDLQAKLGTMLAQRDATEETQLASLVKTYENMKPTDAAKIFNKLDRQIMLLVAARMKPAKIGAVMAAMDPARAQELTVMLATRMNLARPAEQAVPATAPTPPPAPEAQPQAAATAPTPPPT
jgi:flagellar motility protein MotE (MotC chaperone)